MAPGTEKTNFDAGRNRGEWEAYIDPSFDSGQPELVAFSVDSRRDRLRPVHESVFPHSGGRHGGRPSDTIPETSQP